MKRSASLPLTVLISLAALLCLAGLASASRNAAPAAPPAVPLGAPCQAGGAYQPACDLDHDGDVDITDIQLAAGHWGQSGPYVETSWQLTGNAGTVPGTNFLGTTDNQALELRVNGQRALRLEPSATSPNLIGGNSANWLASGVSGATIGGGGTASYLNRVTDDYGTVGGGADNQAGDNAGTTADNPYGTVGGGNGNTATGVWATVGGGYSNDATVVGATIGGGVANTASGQSATVGGGQTNTASGESATVAGGRDNAAAGAFSFAAGFRAKANNTGCFVWADATAADYVCSTDNQFAVRASGGVDFQTGAAALRVNGNTAWHAGNDGAGSTLDADLLDGQHAGAFQQKHGNVVVVAKSGGDFTSIQAALTSITGASDTNRYLVWVAPGVYTETVTMKPYVDIEGAGELLTTISSGGGNGTVAGASNAELRFLTVRNTGGVSGAIAISNYSPSGRFTHVTATASGGTNNYGVFNASGAATMTNVTATASGGTNNYGVYNGSGAATMTNVTATASGGTNSYGVYNYFFSQTMSSVTASALAGTNNYGVYNSFGSPTMMNVTATASGGTNSYGVYILNSSPTIQNSTVRTSGGTSNYGIYNSAGGGSYTVKVSNCQVTGSTNTISNDTEFTVRIGASQLDGGAVTGGGTVTCIGVYDENYASPGYTTCP